MLVMLIQLLVQLIIAAVTLAVRLALAIGYLVGTLLAWLLGAAWTAWRNRRAANVSRPTHDAGWDSPDVLPPTPPVHRETQFTPRPLRRRPRR